MRTAASSACITGWEVGAPYQVDAVDPDWQMYETLEDQGRLLILAAYIDEHMVGYCVSVWTTP